MKLKEILLKFSTDTLYLKDIKCIFCGGELDKSSRYCACDNCFNSLPFIHDKVCEKCGEPINSLALFCMKCKNHVDRGFDRARACLLYRDNVRKAVKDLKYNGKKYFAEYLSKFLLDKYYAENLNCDLIIPVPITEKRIKERGFNQSELLCKSFIDAGLKVDTTSVIKHKNTENQVNLNYKERQENIVDAFKVVDKMAVKDKTILLIDDVYTTGATTGEIARVIKNAGAFKVFVLTLCHEMPEKATN